MSFLDRARALLGIDDEYYDDDYDDGFEGDDVEDDDDDGSFSRSVYRSPYDESSSAVRRMERGPDVDRARRAGAPQVQMHIVEPTSFVEAQSIADKYKQGIPVIMNLSVSDPELSKRLIDFASGLTYGLSGGLQKVSDRVFMLTPENVDVSDAQRRDLASKGLFSFDR